MLRTIAIGLALLTVPALAATQAAPSLKRTILKPEVTVRTVPVTAPSRPFLSSRLDLASLRYVEEEYFLSGTARTYEWVGNSLGVRPVTAPGRYTTRILVLRPADPKKFSGTIEVEPLNASGGVDASPILSTSADYIMRRGDVWIGMTSKPIALNALKRFDAARYADLAWSNPAPAAGRCADPSIIPMYVTSGAPAGQRVPSSSPDSEDGLVWDMYAQLGALLKSDRRREILPGFARPRLVSAGTSQSGMLQRTFLNGFHKLWRLPGGEPIYDAYLIDVGAAMLRINQCSQDVLAADPRNRLSGLDVPVISIVSEGDMWLGVHTRQPDVLGRRAGLVTYEIAGAAHGSGMARGGRSSPQDAARAGRISSPVAASLGNLIPNDFPRGYVTRASLHNLDLWMREGRLPPVGQRLATKGTEIARDADGNALGGVRTMWIEVPTASYQGSLGLGAMAVIGRKTPYAPEKLKALYPTNADYLARVRASVQQSVAGRWILAEDSDAIVEAAAKTPLP